MSRYISCPVIHVRIEGEIADFASQGKAGEITVKAMCLLRWYLLGIQRHLSDAAQS
jgi:hypothetical protein